MSGKTKPTAGVPEHTTEVLAVDWRKIGTVEVEPNRNMNDLLDSLTVKLDLKSEDASNLKKAANLLKTSDVPVAFPTETVYGLGADATRSAAVKGIYKAKQRPADNPLIVHFASLKQLRELLISGTGVPPSPGNDVSGHVDPIPAIYHPLISRFWPGPLTIVLMNPRYSPLAPEVTAGLRTFAARIPADILALALIQQARVPVAAPSANASTKPSPTAASHVAHDLNGRIQMILDGGPCNVGVESTVVLGFTNPPIILRPGGISLEQLRECPGWENAENGYRDSSSADTASASQPMVPGTKYRHYSPKAHVFLYESNVKTPATRDDLEALHRAHGRLGVITTKRWTYDHAIYGYIATATAVTSTTGTSEEGQVRGFAGMLQSAKSVPSPRLLKGTRRAGLETHTEVLEIALGSSTADIAQGIFAALRELDLLGVDAIIVEGIDENEGETAAAIMNRLRKAAEFLTDEDYYPPVEE